MDLTVALDARYIVTPDGSVWSKVGMARSFWERYLDVFDRVRIVARGGQVSHAPEGWLRVDGNGIELCRVPDFHGPWECLHHYPGIREAVRTAAPKQGAVILRVASHISNMLENELLKTKRPFGVEVIGDPYEVFAPGVVDHSLRRFFRWHFSHRLKQQCLRAAGAAYVTRHSLQARYPSRASYSVSDVDLAEASFEHGNSTFYSNVELSAESIAKSTYKAKDAGPYRLVTVGSLEQMYKGTDVLIDAIERCVRSGMDLTAVIVGDGRFKARFVAQAERLGLASRINFIGWVTAGEPVRQILDTADLFVLPSLTEGLPRALVEAMARARPCIGSAVGGIPELLDAPELVPASNPVALAAKITEILHDATRMEAMSRRNLSVSREYSDTVLRERRMQFYKCVRDYTDTWEQVQDVRR